MGKQAKKLVSKPKKLDKNDFIDRDLSKIPSKNYAASEVKINDVKTSKKKTSKTRVKKPTQVINQPNLENAMPSQQEQIVSGDEFMPINLGTLDKGTQEMKNFVDLYDDLVQPRFFKKFNDKS